jgi:hypothetical protein
MIAQDVASENPPARGDRQFEYESPDEVCNESLEDARLLPPTPGSGALFGDAVPQALRKVMKSFYDYGRANWTWAQNAGPAAANGGLVKGAINAVACGSFNHNFKWLAENGLGINGITSRQYTGQFLTMPGGMGIDSKWVGNVRTSTEGFPQLKCFKFSGHYWVVHGGINYNHDGDHLGQTGKSRARPGWKGRTHHARHVQAGKTAPGGRLPGEAPDPGPERLAVVANRT